jgi:3-oxoadipate enol-lactonase
MAGALGSTLAVWERQLPGLGKHFRVVRYDARGHGASPAPPGPYSIDDLTDDAVAVLDRLGLERVHFVGLSLGGMVGLRLAAREPGRVDRLAVMAATAFVEQPAPWADRAALVRAEGTAAVAQTVVSRWLTAGYAAAHPEDVAWLVAMVQSTSAQGYASSCAAIEHLDLRADLPRILAPTLVVGGAADTSMPLPNQELIAAAVPGATLRVVADAAHLANVEHADEVNALLVDFLTAG